jgi:hypothetical protein
LLEGSVADPRESRGRGKLLGKVDEMKHLTPNRYLYSLLEKMRPRDSTGTTMLLFTGQPRWRFRCRPR